MATKATLENPFQHNGPYPTEDLLKHGSYLLDLYDIAHCNRVCRAWSSAMKNPDIWLRMFEEEKIPLIEGRESTTYEDFNLMFPITYSKRKIGCLGEFIGIVPKINAKAFEQLKNADDRYEPVLKQKKMCKTCVVIVEPTYIHRPYDEGLVIELRSNGDFNMDTEISELKERGLFISYSLKNLKILAGYPLKGKNCLPVFSYFHPKILNQCNIILDTVKVSIMRREVPIHSLDLTFTNQKKLLKKDKFKMVTILTRLYFDVVEILTKNTCPDKYEKQRAIFSRTSDIFQTSNRMRSVAIGGYRPGKGLIVSNFFQFSCGNMGAVPCMQAKDLLPAGEKATPAIQIKDVG